MHPTTFSASKPVAKDRIRQLIEFFKHYVEGYDKEPPFTDEQLRAHLDTIRRRRAVGSVAAAISDEIFIRSLHRTLRAWGLGRRKSRLVGLPDFTRALVACLPKLVELDEKRLDTLLNVDETAERLWRLVDVLRICHNQNNVVAASKCLHHLLPDLVPPMDREYTQTFFGWHNREFQYHPEDCFEHAFRTFADIASAVQPAHYVGDGWRTSLTKVLDNAIVAFCRLNGLESSNRKRQRLVKEKHKAMVARAKELGIWEGIEAEAKRRAEAATSHTRT